MSLDQLVKRSSPSKAGLQQADNELFLPPEYNLTIEQWRELFEIYNRTNRPVKVADTIQHYIREHNPGVETNNLFSIDKIVEREGRFFANATFLKTKPALTALYIYKAENVKLVPIIPANTIQQIAHVALTYVPE